MEPAADQSSPSNPRRSTRLADRFHAHDHETEKFDQDSASDSDEDLLPIYEVEIPSDEDEADIHAAYRLPPRTASKLRQIYEASAAEHKRFRAQVLGEQRERLQEVLEELERGPRTERDELAIGRLRAAVGYEDPAGTEQRGIMDGEIGRRAEETGVVAREATGTSDGFVAAVARGADQEAVDEKSEAIRVNGPRDIAPGGDGDGEDDGLVM
ncbi:hypothetical protein LTR86_008880 [Recurvomyces mirabilis]|nr:hypothetical protein LTR86_008880 [Recurvomyces mirabilis]